MVVFVWLLSHVVCLGLIAAYALPSAYSCMQDAREACSHSK